VVGRRAENKRQSLARTTHSDSPSLSLSLSPGAVAAVAAAFFLLAFDGAPPAALLLLVLLLSVLALLPLLLLLTPGLMGSGTFLSLPVKLMRYIDKRPGARQRRWRRRRR
jgi:hypothetical protein